MLYNGVPEANNPPKGSGTSQPGPVTETNECAGLSANKYNDREAIRDVIENKFCKDAVAQGTLDPNTASIARRYYEGTPEEVEVAIDFQPGLDFKPNEADCLRLLLNAVTDGCDGNDPEGNPQNYKGGGKVTAGEVTYRIQPRAPRQPAKNGIMGGCDSAYKVLFNDYVMWGHGWSSKDFGEALKGQVDDCALLPGTWDFQYGLGDDGREVSPFSYVCDNH